MKRPLPEFCFVRHPETNETVIIKYGIEGYMESEDHKDEDPDTLNEKLNITKDQRESMLYGSMFGWNQSIVNTKLFDHEGRVKNIKRVK